MEKERFVYVAVFLGLCLFCLTSVSCVSVDGIGRKKSSEEGKIVYNKYNIHAQRKGTLKANASYANWIGPYRDHFIVPPNTPLKMLAWRSGVKLMMDDGTVISFLVDARRLGMSVDEYVEMITSPTKVSLKGVSALDRKGVTQGKVLKGMTRKGVMTALGYPAPHKTPSLESREWIYWKQRFGTVAVVFGNNGRVSGIRE